MYWLYYDLWLVCLFSISISLHLLIHSCPPPNTTEFPELTESYVAAIKQVWHTPIFDKVQYLCMSATHFFVSELISFDVSLFLSLCVSYFLTLLCFITLLTHLLTDWLTGLLTHVQVWKQKSNYQISDSSAKFIDQIDKVIMTQC